jgi:hypothetical protein
MAFMERFSQFDRARNSGGLLSTAIVLLFVKIWQRILYPRLSALVYQDMHISGDGRWMQSFLPERPENATCT